ncbi:MAG: GNAT family N-acetyltransferase [Pirellulales bacterium]
MPSNSIPADVIETFVRGHATTKSRTHPYLVEQVDGLWVMRDAPRKSPSADYRKEEWIVYGVPAEKVERVIRRESKGWYFIGAFVDAEECVETIRDDFKALGYRLLSSEFLFVHSLQRIPQKKSFATVGRMKSKTQLLSYAQAARMRPMPETVLETSSEWWHYLATVQLPQDNDQSAPKIVGWVSSIKTDTNSHWVSNLVVQESFRRKGIGSALLAQMLRDDRKREAKTSVLLASHTGALVYPGLGYQQLGTLLIFAPKRK